MRIVRFVADTDVGAGAQIGILEDEQLWSLPGIATVGQLLHLPTKVLRQRCEAKGAFICNLENAQLLPPIDARTEVWAAGVTYQVSQRARMGESERSATVYAQVYDAERPELFYKSTAWRVVGTGEPIAIRADSEVNVPEPELALVVNVTGEIVGYTICNDVSSRTIEAENPLYLPQAKVFLGSCAVGPGIRPAWEVVDPYALGIRMDIKRDQALVWSGETNTAQLHRRLNDLVSWLFRAEAFPDGVVLSTGTCLVPDLPFTLQAGDVVGIDIDDVGRLENDVTLGMSGVNWLANACNDPTMRLSRSVT
jgi:2-dehydro-3-deoxy-D-arabinonate dehydratase